MRGLMLRATGRAAEAAEAFAGINITLITIKAICIQRSVSEYRPASNDLTTEFCAVPYARATQTPDKRLAYSIFLSALLAMQKSRAWAVVRQAVKNRQYAIDGASEETQGWDDATTPLLSALRRQNCPAVAINNLV